MVVNQKMTSASLDLYTTPEAALKKEGKKFGETTYHEGQRGVIYAAQLSDDKFPKGAASSGCYLSGKITLFSDDKLRTAGAVRTRYVLTEYSKKQNKALSTVTVEPKKEKSKDGEETEKELKEAIRDLEIKYLSKITDNQQANELFRKLNTEFPNHLPLLVAQVERISSLKSVNLQELSNAVNMVMDTAKPEEVLKFYGGKTDFSEEDIKQNSEMEKRKAAIISVLFSKANVYLDEHLKISTQDVPKIFREGLQLPKSPKKKESTPPKSPSKASSPASDTTSANEDGSKSREEHTAVGGSEEKKDTVESIVPKIAEIAVNDSDFKVTLRDAEIAFREFAKWGDLNEERGLLLSAKYAIANARYGTALRNLNKIVEEKGTTSSYLTIERAIVDVSFLVFQTLV